MNREPDHADVLLILMALLAVAAFCSITAMFLYALMQP